MSWWNPYVQSPLGPYQNSFSQPNPYQPSGNNYSYGPWEQSNYYRRGTGTVSQYGNPITQWDPFTTFNPYYQYSPYGGGYGGAWGSQWNPYGGGQNWYQSSGFWDFLRNFMGQKPQDQTLDPGSIQRRFGGGGDLATLRRRTGPGPTSGTPTTTTSATGAY